MGEGDNSVSAGFAAGKFFEYTGLRKRATSVLAPSGGEQ